MPSHSGLTYVPVSYSSPSRSPSPEGDTIKVGKLTKNVMAGHLEEIFDVYGKIVDIDLPIDKKSELILFPSIHP